MLPLRAKRLHGATTLLSSLRLGLRSPAIRAHHCAQFIPRLLMTAALELAAAYNPMGREHPKPVPKRATRTMRLSHCHNFHDFRRLTRRRLPAPIFNYIDGAPKTRLPTGLIQQASSTVISYLESCVASRALTSRSPCWARSSRRPSIALRPPFSAYSITRASGR